MWLLRISSILVLSLSISQCGSIQNTELGNIKLSLINSKPKVSMAENFNEAPPLTPTWVRVRMNVAYRLPTNVVQPSTHFGTNHDIETIQSGSSIHRL